MFTLVITMDLKLGLVDSHEAVEHVIDVVHSFDTYTKRAHVEKLRAILGKLKTPALVNDYDTNLHAAWELVKGRLGEPFHFQKRCGHLYSLKMISLIRIRRVWPWVEMIEWIRTHEYYMRHREVHGPHSNPPPMQPRPIDVHEPADVIIEDEDDVVEDDVVEDGVVDDHGDVDGDVGGDVDGDVDGDVLMYGDEPWLYGNDDEPVYDPDTHHLEPVPPPVVQAPPPPPPQVTEDDESMIECPITRCSIRVPAFTHCCNRLFEEEALKMALSTNNRCPVCRTVRCKYTKCRGV